jgi:hypothetical protein
MFKHVLVGVLALTLVAACGSAYAASSLEGPTGIVNVPTTDLAEPGKGDVALTWQDLEGDFTRKIVRGVYGVAPGWEVGALWNKIEDGEDTDIWGLNVKYRLMREPEQDYGLALGAAYDEMDMDFSSDLKWTRYYLVLSKKLSTNEGDEESSLGQLTGLVGVVSDRVKADPGGSETDTNIMLGLETVARDGTYVGIDWRPKWKDVGDSIMSVVVRRAIGKSASAELGMTNSIGPLGAEDSKVFVGLSWAFGAGKAEEGEY